MGFGDVAEDSWWREDGVTIGHPTEINPATRGLGNLPSLDTLDNMMPRHHTETQCYQGVS